MAESNELLRRWVTAVGAVGGEVAVPATAALGVTAGVVGMITDSPVVSTCGALGAAMATLVERKRANDATQRMERIKERSRDQRYRFDSEMADLRQYLRAMERQMWDYRMDTETHLAQAAARIAELSRQAPQQIPQPQLPARIPSAQGQNFPTSAHPNAPHRATAPAAPAMPQHQYGPQSAGHPSGPIPVAAAPMVASRTGGNQGLNVSGPQAAAQRAVQQHAWPPPAQAYAQSQQAAPAHPGPYSSPASQQQYSAQDHRQDQSQSVSREPLLGRANTPAHGVTAGVHPAYSPIAAQDGTA